MPDLSIRTTWRFCCTATRIHDLVDQQARSSTSVDSSTHVGLTADQTGRALQDAVEFTLEHPRDLIILNLKTAASVLVKASTEPVSEKQRQAQTFALRLLHPCSATSTVLPQASAAVSPFRAPIRHVEGEEEQPSRTILS